MKNQTTKMAKDTKKVVVGEEGHGAGDAGAVPAPATTTKNTTPDDGGSAVPDEGGANDEAGLDGGVGTAVPGSEGGANDDAVLDGGVGTAIGDGLIPGPSEEKEGDPFAAAVNEAFALHPMDRLYVTSDGQVFGNEKHAHNHARSLPVRLVETVDRNTWGK